MVKRKKDKKNDPHKLPSAKASTTLPASQLQSTTSRSTLGLLYQKVFDPRHPRVFVFGLFDSGYLPLVPEPHIKMSIDNAKVLKTEPLVEYSLYTL